MVILGQSLFENSKYIVTISFLQETETPKLATQQMTVTQPCIIVLGTLENVASTFLVVEKEIHCQVPPKEIAVAIQSAFWAFNMEYTPGCCNIFTFFEVAFLNGKIRGKKTRLSHVLAQLFEPLQ